MIYLGIDIAKRLHVAAAISSDGEIIIGLESTTHYGNNLVVFLFSHEFNITFINPFQTSVMRKNNIRKTKTDKMDAMLVAKNLLLICSLKRDFITRRDCFHAYDSSGCSS